MIHRKRIIHLNKKFKILIKNIHGIINNNHMQVYEVHWGGGKDIKFLFVNLRYWVLCIITINILIGAIILKYLTEGMCQKNYKRLVLEIIVGYLVLRILIYTVSLLIMEYNWQITYMLINIMSNIIQWSMGKKLCISHRSWIYMGLYFLIRFQITVLFWHVEFVFNCCCIH